MNNKEIARQALEQASEDELAQLLQEDPRVNKALWKIDADKQFKQQRQKASTQLASLTQEQHQTLSGELSQWAVQHATALYGDDAIQRVEKSRNFTHRYESLPLLEGVHAYLADVAEAAEQLEAAPTKPRAKRQRQPERYPDENAMAEALSRNEITPADAQDWYSRNREKVVRYPGRQAI